MSGTRHISPPISVFIVYGGLKFGEDKGVRRRFLAVKTRQTGGLRYDSPPEAGPAGPWIRGKFLLA